ncbi:hypothetical protein DBV15_06051 [Temnothorax longispinosus]|uniref:Uncharacterized protein n=1 Tax=Temnothorax longispinosus TaxID=300112 RepID=A0A4S2L0D8_9HYME|nr:hypothetical protein DBV15_06051 [Temnothorax longispinosus]
MDRDCRTEDDKNKYHFPDLDLARAIAVDVVVRESSIYLNGKIQLLRSGGEWRTHIAASRSSVYRDELRRSEQRNKTARKERTLRQCTRYRNRRYHPFRNIASAVSEPSARLGIGTGWKTMVDYRGSSIASVVAGSKPTRSWDKPQFDDIAPRNVTAIVGQTAELNCYVKHPGDRVVTSAAPTGDISLLENVTESAKMHIQRNRTLMKGADYSSGREMYTAKGELVGGKIAIVSADTKLILLIPVEARWSVCGRKRSLGFPPEASFDYEPLS